MADAVERVRSGDSSCATVVLVLKNGDVQVEQSSTESVGDVASALPADMVAFVYGRVMLDEAKGTQFQALESVGRKKMVLLTWVGEGVPAAERGRLAEMKAELTKALPGLHWNVEIQANTAAEAAQDVILAKVKTSSGAFYDNGAEGADQTVETVKAETAAPTAKAAPKGGRKLVKRGGA